MTNLSVFVILGILNVAQIFVKAIDFQSEPPVIKIYEVYKNRNIVRRYDRDNNAEVIVEYADYLRLQCNAYYPVQWIYTGNGIPTMSSSISFSTTQYKNGTLSKKYTASALLSPLKEYHTGTYQCSHTEYITTSPNIHIYVPGPDLFSSLHGEIIQIQKTSSTVLIPCSVSHPRVQVSLEKLDKKGYRSPVNEAGVYNPREGFRVNLNYIEHSDGIYICTAGYKQREYNVTSDMAELRLLRCNTHTDCPSKMNCYTDHLCRDPCSYSIRCGEASKCRVINNVPECYCPPGFVGNAMEKCFNKEESTPEKAWSLEPTSEKAWSLEPTSEKAWSLESTSEKAWISESSSEKAWSLESTSEKDWSLESTSEKDWSSESTSEKAWSSESTSEKAFSLESTSEKAWSLESTSEKARSSVWSFW